MREDYGLKMDFGQPLGRDFFHFWLVELIRLVVLDLYWHYRWEMGKNMDMSEDVSQAVPFSTNAKYMQYDLPFSVLMVSQAVLSLCPESSMDVWPMWPMSMLKKQYYVPVLAWLNQTSDVCMLLWRCVLCSLTERLINHSFSNSQKKILELQFCRLGLSQLLKICKVYGLLWNCLPSRCCIPSNKLLRTRFLHHKKCWLVCPRCDNRAQFVSAVLLCTFALMSVK